MGFSVIIRAGQVGKWLHLIAPCAAVHLSGITSSAIVGASAGFGCELDDPAADDNQRDALLHRVICTAQVAQPFACKLERATHRSEGRQMSGW